MSEGEAGVGCGWVVRKGFLMDQWPLCLCGGVVEVEVCGEWSRGVRVVEERSVGGCRGVFRVPDFLEICEDFILSL